MKEACLLKDDMQLIEGSVGVRGQHRTVSVLGIVSDEAEEVLEEEGAKGERSGARGFRRFLRFGSLVWGGVVVSWPGTGW